MMKNARCLTLAAVTVALTACTRTPSEFNEHAKSAYDGQWTSSGTSLPVASLDLTSRGDSLFGTLSLSGRQLSVVGKEMRSSFRVVSPEDPQFSVNAVRLDGQTLKARLEAGEQSFDLVLRRVEKP